MFEHLKFVIVGHVDHGKSTLIGRLLYDTDSLPEEKIEEVRRTCEELGREMEFGFVMDHLEEERSQGITIDTAQTFFKTGKRRYVIIDAPGHKEFIKNMITGASQAEAAILIVDAHDGVKEQTKRHAYLLRMLGLDQVIVVINKMDLVGHAQARFHEVQHELMTFLSSLGIAPTFTIPISARDGDNVAFPSDKMPWYDGPTVLDGLDSFLPREAASNRPLRFPIQDVYKVKDKRILVGRVEAGKICQGDEVAFLPQEARTTVRSIESLWQEKTEAEAGESIGVTLAEPLFIERGAVACPTGNRPVVTSKVQANVFWMSKRPFRVGEDLSLRIATQEVPVDIRIERKIDSSTLEPICQDQECVLETEVAEVEISTRQPIVVENFNYIQELGRFVLTRGLDVVAGGIITRTALG
ncbi:MAG: GTP-binding protein [Acidobacteriia bacterium]|nr:GTP-binding protein [Terriglobia bacterium]